MGERLLDEELQRLERQAVHDVAQGHGTCWHEPGAIVALVAEVREWRAVDAEMIAASRAFCVEQVKRTGRGYPPANDDADDDNEGADADKPDKLAMAVQLDELCRGFAPNFLLVGNMRCDEIAAVARMALIGIRLSRQVPVPATATAPAPLTPDERDALRDGLRWALETLEEAWPYAGAYFQNKWRDTARENELRAVVGLAPITNGASNGE